MALGITRPQTAQLSLSESDGTTTTWDLDVQSLEVAYEPLGSFPRPASMAPNTTVKLEGVVLRLVYPAAQPSAVERITKELAEELGRALLDGKPFDSSTTLAVGRVLKRIAGEDKKNG